MKTLENISINYIHMGVISITIGAILKYGNFTILPLAKHTLETSSYVTLFSTISTILASIFALIFVVLTISIQLSNKYTSFNLFLNRETKFLVGVYFFTIISSLFMILCGYYFPIFALTLTVFCILSLYPFLHNINSRILYEIGIKNLGEEISEFIDSERQASASHRIEEIGSLGEIALRNNNFQSIDKIVGILSKNSDIAGEKKLFRVVEEIGTQYIRIISQCSIITKEEIIDRLLSEITMYMEIYPSHIKKRILRNQYCEIKNLGVRFIQDNFKEQYILSIEKILFYGLESKHDEEWDSDENGINYLGDLAKLSFQKSSKKPLEEALACLWLIGSIIYREIIDLNAKHFNYISIARYKNIEEKQLRYKIEFLNKNLDIVIYALKSIEQLCDNDEFEKLYDNCKNSQIHPWITNFNLPDFKKYYSNQNNST